MIRLLDRFWNWLIGDCYTIESHESVKRRKEYKRITEQDIASVKLLHGKNKDLGRKERLSYEDIGLLCDISASSVGRIVRGEYDVKESN